MNLSLLLLACTMKKLEGHGIDNVSLLCDTLDDIIKAPYFKPKNDVFYRITAGGIFDMDSIDILTQPKKRGERNPEPVKEGLAMFYLYDADKWGNPKGKFTEFETQVKEGKIKMSPKEVFQFINPLFPTLEYQYFLDKAGLNGTDTDKKNDSAFYRNMVGTYYSYISYQDLPNKTLEKGIDPLTKIDPHTKVVKAVWRMYLDTEGKLWVERKGLDNSLRKGHLEKFSDMIYIHLFDVITPERYTVYTSRIDDKKKGVITCNRIYAPKSAAQPYVFKEILFKQTSIRFEKEKTQLINWNDPDITDDIRNFISFPITPYYNDIKLKNISSLKGLWKIYFWQKIENNTYKHTIRVCYMIITGQFNIRYKVPSSFIYWNGYIQEIEDSQKFTMFFKEKKRHSIFNFQLENINNFETVSLITAGYTVSGSTLINSGVAVLKKQELIGRNVNDLNIEDEEFNYKDYSLEDFIKEKSHHEILKHIPQPEFSIPISKHRNIIEDKWYFGDWVLFTTKNISKNLIHVSKLKIVSNSFVYFNGSRTGESMGYVTASGANDILEIELMGENKRGFLISKGADDELEIGFVSIDAKQAQPSLGIGYLVREAYFNENYEINEPLLIKDYDKSSPLYTMLAEKQIINKLQRFQVGNEKSISYFIPFIQDFFRQNIPLGIMKNHERYLEYHIKSLINTIEKKTLLIPVVDKKVFSDFYNRILQNCAKGTLRTTSIPTKGYFWEEGNIIETQMQHFVDGGGQIYRYFYIYDSAKELPLPTKEILKRHFEIYGNDDSKGAVYITKIDKLSEMDKCVVDMIIGTILPEDGKVENGNSWEVDISRGKIDKINNLIISSSEDRNYENIFELLNSYIKTGETVKITKDSEEINILA